MQPRKIRNILVPIDLSDESALLLQWALAECNSDEDRLTLLHVVETHHLGWELISRDYSDEKLLERAREAAGAGLSRLGDDHPFPIDASVRWGKPAEEILRFAEDNGIDLIVIGRHGAGTMAARLLGGTADKVIRAAPCPVLVVPLGPRR